MNKKPAGKSGKTLLLIDDSSQDLALLSEYLRESCFRLVVAFDGQEGYQKAIGMLPDLILMDVFMPKTDGFAACRLLKADPRTRHIPIIFLTASNNLEERLLGLRLGAVDYIGKPFSPEEVQLRVGIHLDLHRGRLPSDAPVGEPDAADGINGVVLAATNIMLEDLSLTPSLVDIAHQVGTNERRLTELFRAATGMPVFAWLREQRFLLARRLLVETHLDIQQVAAHVGYGNAGNFTTMFRERFGMTPREYRQIQRERQGDQA